MQFHRALYRYWCFFNYSDAPFQTASLFFFPFCWLYTENHLWKYLLLESYEFNFKIALALCCHCLCRMLRIIAKFLITFSLHFVYLFLPLSPSTVSFDICVFDSVLFLLWNIFVCIFMKCFGFGKIKSCERRKYLISYTHTHTLCRFALFYDFFSQTKTQYTKENIKNYKIGTNQGRVISEKSPKYTRIS